MAFSYTTFFDCVSKGWQFAIGDPTAAGWGICGLYALAAILAVRVQRAAALAPDHHGRGRERLLWGLIAGLMIATALNKQLDFQTLILTSGRCLAKEQGWYEDRRLVQRDFILALTVLATLTGAALIWLLRGIVRHNLTALLGLCVLAGFIVIKAGHVFHIFEPEQELADYHLHVLTTILEALSPLLIIAAAWVFRAQPASRIIPYASAPPGVDQKPKA
jgi:hypothetical protein